MVIRRAGSFLKRCADVLVSHLCYRTETQDITDDIRRCVGGSFVGLPQGKVHYQLSGPTDGRTVVLVHGFSVPFYIWDPTFNALTAAGFRVLRYDLYGRGLSDRPVARYDEDFYDKQLLDLIEALAIAGPVDLAGVSMGGTIVATFASRHPEIVRSLVLIDPGFQKGWKPPLRVRTPMLGECYMAAFLAPSLPGSQRSDFYNPEAFPDWPARFRKQMGYKGFRRALLSTMRVYAGRDTRVDYARASQTSRPVLLIWGAGDRAVSRKIPEQVLDLIPQAQLHIIKEAGHLPHLERPELVNPILLDFLSGDCR